MDVSGDCDAAHPPSCPQHLAHPAHCPSLVPRCQADCALCLTCISSVTVHLQPYRGPTPILQMRNDAPRGKAACSGSASCSGEALKFKLRLFGVPESQPVTPGHYCLRIICGINVSINLSTKHKKKENPWALSNVVSPLCPVLRPHPRLSLLTGPPALHWLRGALTESQLRFSSFLLTSPRASPICPHVPNLSSSPCPASFAGHLLRPHLGLACS